MKYLPLNIVPHNIIEWPVGSTPWRYLLDQFIRKSGPDQFRLILAEKKRTSVPVVYLGYAVFTVLFLGLDGIGAALIQTEDAAPSTRENAQLLRAIVVTALWGSYFMLSERVKATFVRRCAHPNGGSANDTRFAEKPTALTEEGTA